jgi:hypothetical protein
MSPVRGAESAAPPATHQPHRHTQPQEGSNEGCAQWSVAVASVACVGFFACFIAWSCAYSVVLGYNESMATEGNGFDHLWSESIPGSEGMAVAWIVSTCLCVLGALVILLMTLSGMACKSAYYSVGCSLAFSTPLSFFFIAIWRTMMAPIYDAGANVSHAAASVFGAHAAGGGFDHLWSPAVPGTQEMAITWIVMLSLAVFCMFCCCLIVARNNEDEAPVGFPLCFCILFGTLFLIILGTWRSMMAPIYDVHVSPGPSPLPLWPPLSPPPPPLPLLPPPAPAPPSPPWRFNLFSIQLTASDEVLAIVLAISVFLFFEVFALKVFMDIPLFRWTSVYLVYLTVLAANDFLSDVFYAFTQDFANTTLSITCIFFTFLPTFMYLTLSGLFYKLLTALLPNCVYASLEVILRVFVGVGDGNEGEDCFGPIGEPLLFTVLKESAQTVAYALDQLKRDLHLGKGHGRLCKSPTVEGFMLTTLKVILWIVPKFICLSVVGLVILAGGLALCLLLVVGVPAAAVMIAILVPLFGILWCTFHINFKFGLFPSATRRLYEYMQCEPPPKESPRSMNLSFVSEIFFESIPQLGLLMTNEFLMSGGLYQPGITSTYQVASSALSILTNLFPFLFWRLRLGKWDLALDEVVYPVLEEHRELLKRRAKHLERDSLTQKEMVDLHHERWQGQLPTASPPSLSKQPSAKDPGRVLRALFKMAPSTSSSPQRV